MVIAMALATTAIGTGCSSESVFCDTFCECEACTDNERQDCTAQLNGTRSYARETGCLEAYEAYLTCASDHGTCVDQTFSDSPCNAENAAFSECLGGAYD